MRARISGLNPGAARRKLLVVVSVMGLLASIPAGVVQAHSPIAVVTCADGDFCVWTGDHWTGVRAFKATSDAVWSDGPNNFGSEVNNDQSSRNDDDSQIARVFGSNGFSGLTNVCLPANYQAGHQAGTSRQNDGQSHSFSAVACSAPNGVLVPD